MLTHTNVHSRELYCSSADTPYVVAMSGTEDGIFFLCLFPSSDRRKGFWMDHMVCFCAQFGDTRLVPRFGCVQL